MPLFFRSSHRRCSIKKLFSKISKCSHETTCVKFSFLIKLQALRYATLLKRGSNKGVFLREYCEISKDIYLENICELLLLVLLIVAENVYIGWLICSITLFGQSVCRKYIKYLHQHKFYELLCYTLIVTPFTFTQKYFSIDNVIV